MVMAPEIVPQQWLTCAEIAEAKLPGMPAHQKSMLRVVKVSGWDAPDREWSDENPTGIWRRRDAAGGGVEYHISLLPIEAQVKLQALSATGAGEAEAMAGSAAGWGSFDRLPDQVKEKAKARLKLLDQVEAMVRQGNTREAAVGLVAGSNGVAGSSLRGWMARTKGFDRVDWLPQLADRYTGRSSEAEICIAAWECFKDLYLREEQPTITRCYRDLKVMALREGWTIPAEKTLARKVKREINEAVRVRARQGDEALKRLYPALERDRAVFHALQAINGDGHRWDVFVLWPDGSISRPMMIVFQDLYSNKVLSWRVDKSENRESIRLALGDIVEQWGIPETVWFDNTRAFANKWLTGGARHRFRWKVRDEDPMGLCEQLGIEVRFTHPYSGQSKPVERVFRDFAHDIAKAPAFAGAYTGHTPMDKPANYGSRAVPLDEFLRVVGGEIAAWNARVGRRTRIAAGRSFDQAFEESFARARDAGMIRSKRPDMDQLWLLCAEGITASKDNGRLELMGNKFWAEFLLAHRGRKLVIRFDPQNVLEGLRVYSLDGRYLGHAEVWEAAGFADANAAREHARQRKGWMRAQKAQLQAERRMSILERAAQLPVADVPIPPPPAGVVRPISFGSAALNLGARGHVAARPDDLDEAEVIELFAKAQRQMGGDAL